ncbi:hypothetical protein CJP16_03000 [Aeromonas sobria]|jgi:hypothetical protein|uniref:Uncharacterized protein n=1 Tax=Aeromonas sobria TaxID=646 RepID=A0A2N3J6H8_AERSO|nr:BcsR/BcsP family cellulose biosynthesis protein [Aeromonas sobria]PKQ80649.1 hypothetical protein CJF47_03305 [Aeromonas sobria]PKQ82193.1 hypothetical protein CJP16_03000 [Aeromonas sobria]TNH95755.1 hypothetical protein CF137_08890 [Aeromonas sobria]TNJ22131.1 hypothetical protein CF111_12025 [Aeromonas sobria]HEH9401670.1 hypothetical protein [Aeromonas sobria]
MNLGILTVNPPLTASTGKPQSQCDVGRLQQEFALHLSYQNILLEEQLAVIRQRYPLLVECDMRHRGQ